MKYIVYISCNLSNLSILKNKLSLMNKQKDHNRIYSDYSDLSDYPINNDFRDQISLRLHLSFLVFL